MLELGYEAKDRRIAVRPNGIEDATDDGLGLREISVPTARKSRQIRRKFRRIVVGYREHVP